MCQYSYAFLRVLLQSGPDFAHDFLIRPQN